MRIRDGEIKDAAAIAALLGELGYPGTEDLRRQDRAHRRASGRAPAGRASRDGGVQGFIGLHFIVQLALPGDFCRITYFCVSEAARGLGVGRELEETAARLAQRCDRIEVHCHERRVDAHRFYYRQGMRNRRST